MKLASLYSGGKDSSYALWDAMKSGHDVTKMVSVFPKKRDSWMFHKPNPNIIKLSSEASDIPLITKKTEGVKEKELEDLKGALADIPIDGIISGALASDYQRKRLEKICKDLNLKLISPIWKLDPSILLDKLIKEDFEVIITSVSAAGLDKDWLGKKLNNKTIAELKKLREKFGIHIAGEGGEYETTVLNAPFFKKRIVIEETENYWKNDRGYFEIKSAKLIEKK